MRGLKNGTGILGRRKPDSGKGSTCKLFLSVPHYPLLIRPEITRRKFLYYSVKLRIRLATMSDLSLLLEEYYRMLGNDTAKEDMMNELQKLVNGLRENEEEFYKEVLNSHNPNFLITAYYSLYLRFVTKVYLKLQANITNSRIKDIFNAVGFFGMPILLYLKKKEVYPYISELSGVLLHALVSDMTLVPSKDSFGYYLFLKLHGDK